MGRDRRDIQTTGRPGDASTELAAALERFSAAPAVGDGVASALGLDDPALVAGGPVEVLGFVLHPGDVVFEAYLICRRSLRIFQLAGDGRSLTLAFPRERVSRVAEEQGPGGHVVTLEVDADAAGWAGEMLIGQALDAEGGVIDGHLAARTQTTFQPVAYRLAADSRQLGDLGAFARAARRMLEG